MDYIFNEYMIPHLIVKEEILLLYTTETKTTTTIQ